MYFRSIPNIVNEKALFQIEGELIQKFSCSVYQNGATKND